MIDKAKLDAFAKQLGITSPTNTMKVELTKVLSQLEYVDVLREQMAWNKARDARPVIKVDSATEPTPSQPAA